MSFQQGLSGLNSSSRALDVIGNNIANSSTIGFKASESHFADMYAASMTGGSALQIGIGTMLATVAQQFTQGNITTTNNPLDIAITGNGFFRMSDRGAISYTRNGQFHLDKDGYFINDGGLRLTGYPASQDGTIRVQTPTDLQITPDLLKLAPVATGASIGGDYAGVRMSVNVDSRVEAKTWTAPTGAIPNIDPNMYNHSTALTIYDSLGNPHTMSFYFVKTANTGEWEIYGNVDGTLSDGAGDVPSLDTPITVTFDSNGALASVNGTAVAPNGTVPEVAMSVDLANVATNLGRVDWGATTPLEFNFSLAGTTQYGAAYSEDRKTQDGYNSGVLAGLSVGGDGIIQGRYSNGQSRNIGQLVLCNFQNPNGLQNIGGNQWIETSASGQPVTGAPGSGLLGSVQSNAVEESNVDLTSELVRMITQQRNYQANAQTIKTQDQVMQTLVNLR
ncbi:MAG: flagellar hook protein FlgE [Rhodocyclaceae bacterium]|nr:flagellar hook protein FlgE [Rhodocyclaceae bacterium]